MQSPWGEEVGTGSYGGHPGLVYTRRPLTFADLLTGVERWADRTFMVQGERRIDFGTFGEKRLLLRYAPVDKL